MQACICMSMHRRAEVRRDLYCPVTPTAFYGISPAVSPNLTKSNQLYPQKFNNAMSMFNKSVLLSGLYYVMSSVLYSVLHKPAQKYYTTQQYYLDVCRYSISKVLQHVLVCTLSIQSTLLTDWKPVKRGLIASSKGSKRASSKGAQQPSSKGAQQPSNKGGITAQQQGVDKPPACNASHTLP